MKTKKNPKDLIVHLKQLSSFVRPRKLSEKIALPKYPNCPGVYVLSNTAGKILYVGQSKQLCRRVSHLTAMQHDKSNRQGKSHVKADLVRKHQRNSGRVFVQFLTTATEAEARSLESDIRAVIDKNWNAR